MTSEKGLGMRWWMAIAVLVAAIALPVATPGTAHACSCVYEQNGPQILEQVARAASVFAGTATEQRIDGNTGFYEFTVREVFAGDVGVKTVVSSSTQSAACGRGFDIGSEYLVFTNTYQTHGAQWAVNSCSATTESTNGRTRDAAIAIYGPPQTPRPDERQVRLDDVGIRWWRWAAGLGGAAVVLTLAVGLVHRRRPQS